MAQIVTITNPLTGQPAKVDQLDHTAQQIDDGLNIARGVSNPNLLDNWYFGNPVDQRGGYVVPPGIKCYSDAALSSDETTLGGYRQVVERTSTYCRWLNANGVSWYGAPDAAVRGYTGAGYGIDRWIFDNDSGNATILLTESGIKFVNGSSATGIGAIHQKLPPELYSALAGKTITISMLGESDKSQQVLLLVNGSVYAVKFSLPDENNLRMTTLTATLPETISGLMAWFYGASSKGVGEGYIKAAKLELGTQQTLAHQDENGNWQLNEIPDYADTFLRCVSSTADPSDTYANVPQRRNNRVIAVKTINGLTTTVYSNDVTVTVSIFGKPTEAINKGTALCDTLPVKYRPPIDYYVRSFYDDETSNVVGVNTTGLITNPLANLKAGAYHRAVLTYSI